MLATLRNVVTIIAEQLADADPDRVRSADAAEVLTVFAEIERLGAAGKMLFAKRAADSVRWRDEGHKDPAAWLAALSKGRRGDAVAAFEAAEQLQGLPGTLEALRRGELSVPQAALIAQAAAERPEAEGSLLQAAATSSLQGLKERCLEVRAGAASAKEEAERYAAIRARRRAHHWTDADGAVCLEALLTPDAGGKVLAALGAEERVCFAEARAAGEKLSPGAAMADALVRLVCAGPTKAAKHPGSRTTPATLCIRVDGTALKRGYAGPGETCTIAGVGPVPVAAVRRQLPDAFVKILVTDAVDVHSVCHVGRVVTAHVESALAERDRSCVVPGCDVAHGLEKHHWDVNYEICKTTSLPGLARVCAWHHDLITYEGYELTGGPGKWEFVPPEGGTAFDTS